LFDELMRCSDPCLVQYVIAVVVVFLPGLNN